MADEGLCSPFGVTVAGGDGTVVVAISGELDAATAPVLDTAIDGVCAGEVHAVVLDLSDMPFVDSSGLGAIVRAHKRLHGARATLRLRGPMANVRHVLRMSGLDKVVLLEDDLHRTA